MPNLHGAIRNGNGKITFLHNYFGMPLWYYLSGKYWVKNNQLNPASNTWDCDRVLQLCKIFSEAEPELGRKLLDPLSQLEYHKLSRYCTTTRNKFNTRGTYSKDSMTKEGIYKNTSNC